MEERLTFKEIAEGNYGFVVMDVWKTHGCGPASRYVNELAVQISDILSGLSESEIGKNAYIAVCSNDNVYTPFNDDSGIMEYVNAYKNEYTDEDKKNYEKLDAELAESDYETGLRSLFYKEVSLGGNGKTGYKRNPYLEMEIVDECSCKAHKNQEGSEGGNGVNPALIPMIKNSVAKHLILTDNTMDAVKFMLMKKVKHVFYVGVHVNMCFLSRKNGLLKMLKHGIQTYIVKDLIDSRISNYNYPYLEHLDATDWFVRKIEQAKVYATNGTCMSCRTVESDYFGIPKHEKRFRFSHDRRMVQSREEPEAFTDNKRDYDQNGRYGFPIGICYRNQGTWLDEVKFFYCSDLEAERDGWEYYPLKPKHLIKGVDVYYGSSEYGKYINGLKFTVIDYGKEPMETSDFIIGEETDVKETLLFQKADIFGQDNYAAYCMETGRTGKQSGIIAVKFYMTLYNEFKMIEKGRDEKKSPFVDCLLMTDSGEEVECYYSFFEGWFYVYTRDGIFIGRRKALLFEKEKKALELSAGELECSYRQNRYFYYEHGKNKKVTGIQWVKSEHQQYEVMLFAEDEENVDFITFMVEVKANKEDDVQNLNGSVFLYLKCEKPYIVRELVRGNEKAEATFVCEKKVLQQKKGKTYYAVYMPEDEDEDGVSSYKSNDVELGIMLQDEFEKMRTIDV